MRAIVSANRGIAMEVYGKATARRPNLSLLPLMAPGYSRAETADILRPLGAAIETTPLLTADHVTLTVQTFIEVNYPKAVATRAKRAGKDRDVLAVLDAVSSVADDLAMCDMLEAPHRGQIGKYTGVLRTQSLLQCCASAFGDDGFTADQGNDVDACSRDMASRFYEHLEEVRKRNDRTRRVAGFIKAAGSVHAHDAGALVRVRGFWGQHVPVVWGSGDHFARDAARYAAVAFYLDPPEPGQLAARPEWEQAQRIAPSSNRARDVAEGVSQRCSCPHFTRTVAWALAWS